MSHPCPCIACEMGIPKKERFPITLKDDQGSLSIFYVEEKTYNMIHIFRSKYSRNRDVTLDIDGKKYTLQ